MTITANIGVGPTDVLAADTDFFTIPNDRVSVGAFYIYNDTAGSITVDVYISPNTTSASGDKVDQLIISPNDGLDVEGVIGQGYTEGEHIILVGGAVGCNATMTYTRFTGGD